MIVRGLGNVIFAKTSDFCNLEFLNGSKNKQMALKPIFQKKKSHPAAGALPPPPPPPSDTGFSSRDLNKSFFEQTNLTFEVKPLLFPP